MGLRKTRDDNENFSFSDLHHEKEDSATLIHKRQVRKMIEDRLERKRLKDEFDELDGEFDWDEIER